MSDISNILVMPEEQQPAYSQQGSPALHSKVNVAVTQLVATPALQKNWQLSLHTVLQRLERERTTHLTLCGTV